MVPLWGDEYGETAPRCGSSRAVGELGRRAPEFTETVWGAASGCRSQRRGCVALKNGKTRKRLLTWSDLHFERWGNQSPVVGAELPDHDILVVAGDVTEDPALSVEIVARIAEIAERPAVLCLGNHECLGHKVGEGADETVGLARSAALGTRVTVLEADTAVIDGVRFVGGTLWTDFRAGLEPQPLQMLTAAQGMREYDEAWILDGGTQRKFAPEDALAIHRRTVTAIEKALAAEGDEPIVMVTHHAPSLSSLCRRFRGDPLNGAFVSALDRLFHGQRAPAVAIHGHVHSRHDYRIGGTRILANPCGYPDEESGFDPGFVIEIGG